MLYPTELRAESPGSNSDTRRKVQQENAEVNLEAGGRGERNRTSDILLPKQALYQAELRPERGRSVPELRRLVRHLPVVGPIDRPIRHH